MSTTVEDLKEITDALTRLSVTVEGEFPPVELRDIPDENWRRIQLGQDLKRLSLAVSLLRQAVEQNESQQNRLASIVALNTVTVLVFADLVLDDMAKVRMQDSFELLLRSIDPGPATPFRGALRSAWVLRLVRNQLLVHRNPDHTGQMATDVAGGVVLSQVPRTTEESDAVERAIRELEAISGIPFDEHDDGALEKLCIAIFGQVSTMGQGVRDRLVNAFKQTGLRSPPIVEMLKAAVQAIEALGPPPAIPSVPSRPRPPGGTLIRALAGQKGNPNAARFGGHLVFTQFRVRGEDE
jgi:hypothetical protein